MNTVGRVQSEWRPEGSNVNLQVPKSSGDGTMPFNVEKDLIAVGPLTKALLRLTLPSRICIWKFSLPLTKVGYCNVSLR